MRDHVTSDRGAVAVIVALLSVALIGFAAFVVDFGAAYVHKVSLQKAADAAALKAAGEIIRAPSTSPTDDCEDIRNDFSTGSQALFDLETSAYQIALENNANAARGVLSIDCSGDSRRVDVQYTNSGSIPTVFGGIFGVSSLSASRTATADIFSSPGGTGLRPYAVCLPEAEELRDRSLGTGDRWLGIEYPSAGCVGYPGNWTVLKCPGERSPSASQLRANTLNGCKEAIGVIPGWDQSTDPETLLDVSDVSNTAMRNDITVHCAAAAAAALVPPATECLQATTGSSMNNLGTEWVELMRKENIALPSFVAEWNNFADISSAGCTDTGSNVCYPVAALLSVKVCGFMFGNTDISRWAANVDPRGGNPSWAWDNSNALCAGVRDDMIANPSTGSNRKLWLALSDRGFQTTGASSPGSGSVGSSFGVYGTRLVQ